MGLAKIRQKAKPQKTKNCAVDLSEFFEEEPGTSVVNFREPGAADLFGVGSRMQKLKAHYPEFPPNLLKQVLILGSCYVPDGTDAEGFDPDISLGSFARENRDLFFYIDGKFVEAFPIAAMLSMEASGNA